MESIDELSSRLTVTNDEREKAGLLDAIGIQLTLERRPLEALDYSSRALEIRARLADEDVGAELLFASSLFNRAAHLRVLQRFEEAVASYALALEVCQRHVEAQDQLFRYADALASLLAQLRCHDMAARFQGLVVEGALAAGNDTTDVNAALEALAAYLDLLDNDVPTCWPCRSWDSGLLSLRTASLSTARELSHRATTKHRQALLSEAVAWATRAVRYCDLFASEDGEFAVLSTENLRRVAAWSGEAGVEIGLTRLARLKGVLTSRSPDSQRRPAPGSDSPIAARPSPPDRRLWCCSIRDLWLLVTDFQRAGIPSSDVHTLARHLRDKKIYPARDYTHRCQPRPPDVFITYDWNQNFVGLCDMIEGALVYMGQTVFQKRNDLDSSRVRQLVFDEVGLWVDFVFIDQTSRELDVEVREILPRAIDSAGVHFVLSDTALLRSWCCYELALFNRRQLDAAWSREIAGHRVQAIQSFVTQEQKHSFRGFAQTVTTVQADKEVIERYLQDEFPQGLAGVDALLLQAAMLDKRITPEFAVPPAAEELMLAALDKWLTR